MIILDARRVKAYECFTQLGEYAGKEEAYLENLWLELVSDDELMGAFMYYLDHHSLSDAVACRGYDLTDLYFYNMRQYEMGQDIGKNYADCNKEGLVLDTFLLMAKFRREPEKYLSKLEGGPGMDRMG